MNRFSYFRPTTIKEALNVAKRFDFDVSYLAGGTDLMVRLKNDQIHRAAVIDLKEIDEIEKGIIHKEGQVIIGALTLLSEVEQHSLINAYFPALQEAVSTIGSVQIRNRATLAGNICNASPAADSLPPLFIYGAKINMVSIDSSRTLPIEKFVTGPGKTVLNQGEFVKSIILPIPAENQAACFDRLTRRRGVDLATINICCQVFDSGEVRFAVGAAAPVPFIVANGSGVLANGESTDQEKDVIIHSLMEKAAPIDDVRASKTYRQAMLTVLAKRTLARALKSLGQE